MRGPFCLGVLEAWVVSLEFVMLRTSAPLLGARLKGGAGKMGASGNKVSLKKKKKNQENRTPRERRNNKGRKKS